MHKKPKVSPPKNQSANFTKSPIKTSPSNSLLKSPLKSAGKYPIPTTSNIPSYKTPPKISLKNDLISLKPKQT